MQNDENTQNGTDATNANNGNSDTGSQSQDNKVDTVTLSPAEYRHFRKWNDAGRPSSSAQENGINRQDASPRESVKPSDILKADEFKLYRQGYNEQEIDLIMHNGGMAALKDDKSPLVLGLKVAREQRTAEERAQQAQDSSGTSTLESKYTKEDLNKMSPAEIEKIIGVANQ